MYLNGEKAKGRPKNSKSCIGSDLLQLNYQPPLKKLISAVLRYIWVSLESDL